MSDPSIIIRTPRLALRKFLIADAAGMFALNADPEVIRYTGDNPFASVAAAEKFIQEYDSYRRVGYGRWTILFDGNYAGWCGLNHNADINETDLGFRIQKKYWGRGIASEAAGACIDYGFTTLGLKKIIGRAMEENKGSIRVLQKTGMTFEKDFEAHGGRCVQYAITIQSGKNADLWSSPEPSKNTAS